MLQLTWGDLWRGLVMAILGPVAVAIFGLLNGIILAPGFDVFAVEWGTLFKGLTNAFVVSAYSGFVGYILKNLLTDDNQDFLGIKTKS